MNSLRIKITAALVATTLLSLLLVGVVARAIILQRFGLIVKEQAFQRFQSDIADYIHTHGSWDAAIKAETFPEYQRRRNVGMPYQAGDSTNGSPGSSGPSSRGWPEPMRRPEGGPGGGPADLPGNNGGPPSDFGRGHPGEGQWGGPGGPAGRLGEAGGERRGGPGGPGGPRRPPFRFILLDTQHKVLLGTEAYPVGSTVSGEILGEAKILKVDGKTIGYGIGVKNPDQNALDAGYLSAIRDASLISFAVALAFTVSLGLFFGNRLSMDLRTLTRALHAMRDGHLAQKVEVKSRDEVGTLAEALNHMSQELDEATRELKERNQLIQRQAEHLRELSVRDELTKLYNRRHFNEQAAMAYAQSVRYIRPLTIMIGDLDHFKHINDGFSHAVGDAVLRRVAGLMRTYTRESDLVARYGGEEFVIAFPETSIPEAHSLCERLRTIIETQNWDELAPGLKVTMSMGLSGDVQSGSFEKMVAAADEQLYKAKENGRNRICLGKENLALSTPAPEQMPAF